MSATETISNYIGGEWTKSSATESQKVINPATQESLAEIPLSTAQDVASAVEAAAAAFPDWRRTPPEERIQPLFKLKQLLEDHLDEICRIITKENGKTLGESKGEMRRAIENVEVACGIPILMQGYNLEDVARGIDETMIRQPLGVVAAITPFNFPGMIPFWFLPYAVATGNTFILKPSERVPLTMRYAFDLLQRAGFPKGVLNLVNGGKSVVDALLDHPKDSRHQLRRLNPDRKIRLRPRRRQRQTRPMPRRRKKPRARPAGRRHGIGHANHQRQRLRLRRPKMPGRLGSRSNRRRAKNFPRRNRRKRLKTKSRRRTRSKRADGPSNHAAKQNQNRRSNRPAAQKKARKSWSTAATPKSPIANPAISSAPQSWKACRQPASWPTPKFSAPS